MSDSGDDWEKQLADEEELEKNLNQNKKKAFKDEDEVDSDEERKKKQEEQKKNQESQPAAKKKQGGKKDYDKLFEERLASHKGGAAKTVEEIQKSNLSKEAKDAQLSMAAEQDITDALFADINIGASQLNLEKDYVNLGKKVSDVLYNGKAPYRIPAFYKELMRDLSKQTESTKIKEILDSMTTIYNEKVKEEKEKEKTGGGKGKGKATLKAGKQIHNTKMIDDVMAEDDYGSEKEYDEDEEGEGASASKKKKGGAKKKVEEEEYDFM